jgi:hypothetical protein
MRRRAPGHPSVRPIRCGLMPVVVTLGELCHAGPQHDSRFAWERCCPSVLTRDSLQNSTASNGTRPSNSAANAPRPSQGTVVFHAPCLWRQGTSVQRETPRLCRGGRRSLTFPGVDRRSAAILAPMQASRFPDGMADNGLQKQRAGDPDACDLVPVSDQPEAWACRFRPDRQCAFSAAPLRGPDQKAPRSAGGSVTCRQPARIIVEFSLCSMAAVTHLIFLGVEIVRWRPGRSANTAHSQRVSGSAGVDQSVWRVQLSFERTASR